jgi:mono/diheme cytochrome c family protein
VLCCGWNKNSSTPEEVIDMAESHAKKPKPTAPPRKFGWMAEFSDEHALLDAARKVKASGYTQTDAFTPFPVHGIDEALGIKPTILPFIVLCAGLCGLATALVMQVWMNAIDYPYIISGKPYKSWPAFIPVSFELTVLFSAFTSFLGMIALNRLPRLSNPVFTNPRFDRVTDDKFFLYVDSRDKYYNSQAVHDLLKGSHPEALFEVEEDSSSSSVPSWIYYTLGSVILASMIPAMVVFVMRNSTSEKPRWHVFFDMDFQPKKKPQQKTTIFADGRAMRPQVVGTVARGQLDQSDPFYLGYDPTQPTAALLKANQLVAMPIQDGGQDAKVEPSPGVAAPQTDPNATQTPPAVPAQSPPSADAGQAAAPQPAPMGIQRAWITEFPLPVDRDLIALGKKKFETYCSVCHGISGTGDGLVARRADQLAQGYWLPPTSLHDPKVVAQPIGQIFYTITNGKGKMAGYGGSIEPRERWAIVLYIQALQRSQDARLEDVPQEKSATAAGPNGG